MKYILFVLIILLLFFAITPIKTKGDSLQTGDNNLIIVSNIPDVVDLNTSRYWNLQVYNSTSFLTTDVTCYLDIYNEYSNGSLIYRNKTAKYVDTSIPVYVPPSTFNDKGSYSFRAYCNNTNQAGLYLKNFYVTKDGEPPANDGLKIFLWSLFILGSLALFYTAFITLINFASFNVTIVNVLLGWGAYILMVILIILAQNYLIITFVEDMSLLFIKITLWTNGIFPTLTFMISFIVKIMKQEDTSDIVSFRRVK